MDPQKMTFLLDLVKEAQTQNSSSLLPFLLSVTARANQQGMQFTDEETEMLMNQLSKNMTPQDQEKIAMIRQMTAILSKKSKK